MTRDVFRFTSVRYARHGATTFGTFARIVPLIVLIAAACSDGSLPTVPRDVDVFRNLDVGHAQLQGATLEVLQNANWDCQERVPGRISCAPPGIGLAPIPPLGVNGRPFYHITVFPLDGTPLGIAHLVRADLYHGQTCAFTGQPFVFRAIIGYYECFRTF
jgi:hypothetical protein